MKKRDLKRWNLKYKCPKSVGIPKYLKHLYSISVLGLVLLLLIAPAAAQFSFDQHEIDVGRAKRQTVLTGFLSDRDVAELAVVHIDEDDERCLRIYAFEGNTWVRKLQATLRPEVSFVDIANIDERDRLVTYGDGHLKWFDPETSLEQSLSSVTSSFDPPRKNQIHHVDITRDLNNDGRDDLAVPDVDGFRVFIQMEDGAFADPVKIGPPTDFKRIYGADGYRYDPWSQSRIHESDYNRDGRIDLVWWNKDHFSVHTQDERGLFEPAAKTFTTDVKFDSDDLSALTKGDMTGKMLHSLTDLNGDGVADLVIYSLEGRTISKKRSAYEVYFGRPTPAGGTTFLRSADTVIRSKRVQIGMDPHDFDVDGQSDLMCTTVKHANLKSNLLWNFRGKMGGSLNLELEFYRMERGVYPGKPNFNHKVKLRFPPAHSEPGWVPLDLALRGTNDQGLTLKERELGAFNSPLLIGDINGDGRKDLFIGWKRRQLLLFIGVPGPDLFARRPQKMNIDIPYDGEYIWLVDLNKDGKQDILMHFEYTDEPNRVSILIAR